MKREWRISCFDVALLLAIAASLCLDAIGLHDSAGGPGHGSQKGASVQGSSSDTTTNKATLTANSANPKRQQQKQKPASGGSNLQLPSQLTGRLSHTDAAVDNNVPLEGAQGTSAGSVLDSRGGSRVGSVKGSRGNGRHLIAGTTKRPPPQKRKTPPKKRPPPLKKYMIRPPPPKKSKPPPRKAKSPPIPRPSLRPLQALLLSPPPLQPDVPPKSPSPSPLPPSPFKFPPAGYLVPPWDASMPLNKPPPPLPPNPPSRVASDSSVFIQRIDLLYNRTTQDNAADEFVEFACKGASFVELIKIASPDINALYCPYAIGSAQHFSFACSDGAEYKFPVASNCPISVAPLSGSFTHTYDSSTGFAEYIPTQFDVALGFESTKGNYADYVRFVDCPDNTRIIGFKVGYVNSEQKGRTVRYMLLQGVLCA